MGLATILMAALLVAGLAAGVALAIGGAGAVVANGLVLALAAFVSLGLVYFLTDGLAPIAAHARRAGHRVGARSAAVFYAVAPMLVLVGAQLIQAHELRSTTPLLLVWLYAVATGPATLLAAFAHRDHATVWSVRAYAGHVSATILITATALGARIGPVLEALCLAPAVVPSGIAYLLALADPDAVRVVRM